MATPQNPNRNDPADVGRIEKEQLAWSNILRLKKEITTATKQEEGIRQQLLTLQRAEAKNAAEYKKSINATKQLEKDIQQERLNGNKRGVKALKDQISMEQQLQKNLMKTQGGALMMLKLRAKATKDGLTTERDLIKNINKERGLGAKIADLFRSKEKTQRQIDIARAKAGGGANTGAPASGGKDTGALAAAGPAGAMAAAMAAAIEKLKAPFKAIYQEIKKALIAPLNEAAGILGTDKAGIGGGKVSGAGATSMLDALSNIASSIPFIGGLLGGLVSGFKTILDAVLGIDQANVNVARSLGVSKKEAQAFRMQMQGLALATHDMVVNQTRLVESQLQLSEAMGVTNKLSGELLVNDVRLADIAGIQVESRKAIAESSVVSGKSATSITKNLIGQIGYLKATTGISFKWQTVLTEVSKLSGVLGLTFAKYPDKLTATLLKVKSLGFDLEKLNQSAGALLNFEDSISKEFEAQVLTGKDINLTKARQAALDNDLATVAQEITKYTGSSADYLKMNRIEADSYAEAMGMTRDGLADVLKQQELLGRMGARDVNQAKQIYESYRKRGLTQEQMVRAMGEENYQKYTEISIAERLAAVMEKIKQTFLDFVERSKIFEFLTNPQRVNAFINTVIQNLAGAVNMIGDIIASLMEGISHIPFTDKGKWQGYADSIRGGAGNLAGNISSIAFEKGGVVPGTSKTGDNVIANVNSKEMVLTEPQQANLFKMANNGGAGGDKNINLTANIVVGGEKLSSTNITYTLRSHDTYLDNSTGHYP